MTNVAIPNRPVHELRLEALAAENARLIIERDKARGDLMRACEQSERLRAERDRLEREASALMEQLAKATCNLAAMREELERVKA